MKMKDYNQTIDCLDAEVTTILEKLDQMDPSSEEYAKAAANLKTLQEAKQVEVRNKSEHLSGKVPAWATWIGSALITIGFWKGAKKIEQGDGMFPNQMVNFWDKFRPKF